MFANLFRGQRAWQFVGLGAALASALLLGAFVLGCNKGRPTDEAPREARAAGAPDDWTHKELLDHLNRKGVKYRLVPTNMGRAYGVGAFFVRDGSPLKDEQATVAAYDANSPDVVYVSLQKNAEAARDQAGAANTTFAWGRFVFAGPPEARERIRAALP